jgi:hypothetical protein
MHMHIYTHAYTHTHTHTYTNNTHIQPTPPKQQVSTGLFYGIKGFNTRLFSADFPDTHLTKHRKQLSVLGHEKESSIELRKKSLVTNSGYTPDQEQKAAAMMCPYSTT